MQAKTLVLVLIAMVCGLAATMGISQFMEQQGAGRPVETVKIFVAATDIDIGAALNAQNVKLEEWPRDRVPDGAVSKLEELEGRFARQRLYPGEPILVAKLMDSNSDTSMTIPEGYRACSIKVSGEIAVGNLVKPGDRVDVIVVLHKSQDVPVTTARTILRDVRVWAVNEKTERSVDDMGKVTVAQTVSLLVTPKQVELLTLATQLGDLRLSLRRPNDSKDADDSGITVNDLLQELRGRPEPSAPRPPSPPVAVAATHPDTGPGTVDRLLRLFERVRSGNLVPASGSGQGIPRAASAPKVQFSMLVHSPEGVVRYDWTDERELPHAVVLTTTSAGAVTESPRLPPPEASPLVSPTPPGDSTSAETPTEEGLGTKINVP